MARRTKRMLKRARFTADEVAIFENQLYQALAADNPQSVRHVFYLMTNPRLPLPVEKTDAGYEKVQTWLVRMRRANKIPYEWIVDATRTGYHVATYGSAADFVSREKEFYRADLWEQSDHYVEVWCESRSIGGMLQETCQELCVSLYPTGGFGSLSLNFEAARIINDWAEDKAEGATIFYIGDYDPAGVMIDVKTEQELRRHLRPHINLNFVRLGITAEQIAEYDLPTKLRKASEKRAPHITHTVEAEAMPAHMMRDLVREAVETLLPERAFEIAKIAEEEAQKHFELMEKLLPNRRR